MNDPKLRVCFMSNAIIYIQNNLFCAVKICRQNEHSRTVSVNAPRERVFLCTFLFRSGARERSSFVLHFRLTIKLFYGSLMD